MLINVGDLTEKDIEISKDRAINISTKVAYLKNNGLEEYTISCESIIKQIEVSNFEE